MTTAVAINLLLQNRPGNSDCFGLLNVKTISHVCVHFKRSKTSYSENITLDEH